MVVRWGKVMCNDKQEERVLKESGRILDEEEETERIIATLPFYERSDLLFAVHGIDYWSALYQLDQRLREAEKHRDRETIPIDEVRQWIREELDERGLSLEGW